MLGITDTVNLTWRPALPIKPNTTGSQPAKVWQTRYENSLHQFDSLRTLSKRMGYLNFHFRFTNGRVRKDSNQAFKLMLK